MTAHVLLVGDDNEQPQIHLREPGANDPLLSVSQGSEMQIGGLLVFGLGA
jgi:hypothetical protein